MPRRHLIPFDHGARLVMRAAAFFIVGLSADARAGDDDVVVIDDGGPPPGDGGAIVFDTPANNSDDTVIIVDEGEELPSAAEVATGPLGRVWDAWHVATDSDVLAAAQFTDLDNGSFRLLGSVWVETWLLPAPNLSVYGTAFGRLAYDGAPGGRTTPLADVYELFAKIKLDHASVQLGRFVVPWGRTQAVGFGDRLHPPDVRRGPTFPDPARQKQPQLGAQAKGGLGVVGVEAVGFVSYEPTEGALTAANQGGLRLGRYQTALARSPLLAGGLLDAEDTSAVKPAVALGQPTLAARAWRRIGEIDVSASAAFHFDEVPSLSLPADVTHALSAEGLAALGLPGPAAPACSGQSVASCLGAGALTYAQTTSFSLDASWGLGLVVVRAEAVAYPKVGELGGKTALLVSSTGLSSTQVSQLAAAVAVEGQLGPAVDGSLELFDVAWDGVPADAHLWGVELLESDTQAGVVAAPRTVHRLAAGANLGGALFDDRVMWRLRGEAGVLQADVLLSAEVRYRLPVFDLYIGGRGDVFTGRRGSPGWMKQEASLVGIFLGEGV